MINLDDKLAQGYLAECRGHLDTVETDLLAIEKGGAYVDGELVNRVIRAVHSVKGRANVLDLVNIHELAHQTEEVLGRILSRNLVPTPDRVHLLLRATDRLRELIQDPGASNQADIAEIMDALSRLCASRLTGAEKRFGSAVGQAQQGGRHLRVLLVEDDFASRLLLQTFLSRYGECHIAVNGSEAVEAFRSALERGLRYDLICMDIMMPEMDGREAVRQVRALEEEHGILSTYGAKIIMTTAVDEIKEVIQCFRELCDAYLMKPIDLAELRGHMKSYQLVQ
jgi:two-component system, chemotaxis family, chemotaxis protein CheY